MKSSLVVRIATVEDAPQLSRLNEAFNGVQEAPERLAARLADPRRVETPIIAEIGGRAAGFACLRLVPCLCYDPVYAELTEMFVKEAYRRQGVGRALIARAEQLAEENEATEIFLVTGSKNVQGQVFYGATGYTDHARVMRKSLKRAGEPHRNTPVGQNRADTL
jgi:GNAT superfamily N-acetyltransferase